MEKGLPTFSIIVPTYNRLDQLALCLNALAKIEYPCDRFEVIVVDDGSFVDLWPVLKSQIQRDILKINEWTIMQMSPEK